MQSSSGTVPGTASPAPFRTAAAPALAAATTPVASRTWLRRIIGGGQIVESCPAWCTSDHRMDASGNLDDLSHRGPERAAEVAVLDHWEDGEPVMLKVSALAAQIHVDPYSESPRRNRPFATVEVADGQMADELGPDELATVIAEVRAHADRLEQVRAQLVQARAEYGG